MHDFTTDAYDRSVDRYTSHRRETNLWEKERIVFLRMLNGKRVLDVGCGPGIEAEFFVSKGLSVTGIDKSKGMIKAARKLVPSAEFIQMDMLNISLPLGSFNGIWCCASLFHVKREDAPNAVENMSGALCKNGLIFISVKEGTGDEIRRYPDGTMRFFAYYKMDELSTMLSKRELEVVESYKNTSDPDGDTWLSVFCRKGVSKTSRS